MLSYREIVERTAELEYKIQCRHPHVYMQEVFGISPDQDPKFVEILLRASHTSALYYLIHVYTLPRAYRDSMIRYITREIR